MAEIAIILKKNSGEIEIENSGGVSSNEELKQQLEDSVLGASVKEYQTCDKEIEEEVPEVEEHLNVDA